MPCNILYMNIYRNIIHDSQKWKQLECPSAVEWINKMWHMIQWNIFIYKQGMKY